MRFERALVGGETGANLFTDGAGERWVVKWVDDPAAVERRRTAVAVSERLRREAGWPTPHRRCVEAAGWLFVLQRFVPGAAMTSVSSSAVDHVLELHDRRLGLGRHEPPGDFAEHLIHTLRVGADAYCLHEPLRGFDARGRRFVDVVEDVGASLDARDVPADDLIHWDLHPGNLIEQDGRLVGIIDTDHAKAGDGRVDLVCLGLAALESGATKEAARLRAAAVADLDDGLRTAYVGHLILRFADWAVRRGRTAEAHFWLDTADTWL